MPAHTYAISKPVGKERQSVSRDRSKRMQSVRALRLVSATKSPRSRSALTRPAPIMLSVPITKLRRGNVTALTLNYADWFGTHASPKR
jgi:hypothetical protein